MKIGLADPRPELGMGEETARPREEGTDSGMVKGGVDLSGQERRGH